MKSITTLLILLFSAGAGAQDLQKEINEQVWRPFMTTFNSLDADGFLALHSKDLLRSSRDSKTVLNWEEYLREQRKGDTWSKENGIKRTLELRFTERIASSSQAIDVGIYKTCSVNSKSETRCGYGRFHVALRKEKGVWKILVDTDSSEGDTISEKDFLAAKPMD